jgi:exosortase A
MPDGGSPRISTAGARDGAERVTTMSLAWKQAGLAAGMLFLSALVLYHDTLSSMVAVWWRSDTFAHGAIVFPVCAWLAWRKRAQLATLEPQASVAGLIALMLLVSAWLFARLADVLVAEQFALVAMIPALVWTLFGVRALAVLAFPLAFLAFAVPFGEGLIPALMEFTASFTVRALELTGIPVYREGLRFSIPSGEFEVATACSGIRYLIASLALGTLYAHLTYYTFWRRALFVALSIAVPLLANGVRAWLIVMIAYWSDMKLAVGVDHLIYGWLFFGIVMFALFWLGLTFREREPEPPHDEHEPIRAATRGRLLTPVLLAAGTLAVAPLAARQLASLPAVDGRAPLLPLAAAGWRGPLDAGLPWRPSYHGAAYERLARYEGDDGSVQLAIVSYAAQAQGAELINSENLPYDERWHLRDEGQARAPDGRGGAHTVQATRLDGASGPLLVWCWYVVGAHTTASDALAKLYQVWGAMRGSTANASLIAVATPEVPDADRAAARLTDYLQAHATELAACVGGANAGCGQ